MNRRILPAMTRFSCHNCRQNICIFGTPELGIGSVLSSTQMDNSFVVLPDASVYKHEGVDTNSHSSAPQSNAMVLNPTSAIASAQMQVDQPLCIECMQILCSELDKEIEDVNKDIKEYKGCLQRVERESRKFLSEAEFLEQKLKITEEERKLEAAIVGTEKQCAEVTAELNKLELKSSRFKELEERYWQEVDNFQFQLISHQEERDAILAKIDVSQAHFELLNCTNVLKDAFPISCDGDFGTINNFRLGRLPKAQLGGRNKCCMGTSLPSSSYNVPVLLTELSRYRIKILPMGSYPRVTDGSNNSYELFGPVNLIWSTHYDKAMALYLACLKDFAEFANSKDRVNNIPPEKCFKLPYKIENDKVENHSIIQSFNKQESWTKALKYTLCNLKWALYWFIGNTNYQTITAAVSFPAEVSSSAHHTVNVRIRN